MRTNNNSADHLRTKSGRTYVIADLHGRFDLLCRAINLIEADAPEGGQLICLGDFVDRGPQSRAIIDLLMAGPQRAGWQWTVLQGNHEAMMLEVLGNPNAQLMRWWVGNGGGATLQSYGYGQGDPVLPLKAPDAHMTWLADLPVYVQDEHRIYVHAGVPADQALEAAKRDTMQWMLYSTDDVHGPADVREDAPHCSGKHVVHGHHQFANGPLLFGSRTDLDTFAWATGRLAIGVFEDSKPGGPTRIIDAICRPDSRYVTPASSGHRVGGVA